MMSAGVPGNTESPAPIFTAKDLVAKALRRSNVVAVAGPNGFELNGLRGSASELGCRSGIDLSR